jgi:hypothetical protein
MLFIFMPTSLLAVSDFHSAPDLPSVTRDVAERFPGKNSLISSDRAQIVGFNSTTRDRADNMGQHSRIWHGRNAFSQMTISLDFPFRGWHPLWMCYDNAGWKRLSTEVVYASSDDILGGDFPFYESILENNLGNLAVLHFSLFDEQCQPYQFEDSTEVRQDSNRLQRNLWTRVNRKEQVREPLTFQIQLLSTTNTVPSPKELNELRSLYQNFRRQIYLDSVPIIQTLSPQ